MSFIADVASARFRLSVLPFVIMVGVALLSGCSDSGTAPDQPPASTPPPGQGVSFSTRVLPILARHGCTGCHGGTSGLTVGTVSGLLSGGNHGPAVVPGNADTSLIIKKLSPTPPFGDRMPQGGPYLPDTTIQVIRTWINEGAKNN
jgi:hypothetical protein